MNVLNLERTKFKHHAYPNNKFLELTRVTCPCGHVVNFMSRVPYIECAFCHNLIFRNKKCEYDYKIKRRFKNESRGTKGCK